MKTTLTVCLAAASVYKVMAASFTGNVTIYGNAQLDNQVANQLLACISAINVSYAVFVDSPTTVVIPTEQRIANFDTEDAALLGCIKAVNSDMHVALESNTEITAEHASAIPVFQATPEWLISQGATGKEEMGRVPAAISDGLSARAEAAEGVYHAFLSEDKNCENHDYQSVHQNDCRDSKQSFGSVEFENTEKKDLQMEIWPHHDCKKGDSRTFVVSQGRRSGCQKRTTYSFQGKFK